MKKHIPNFITSLNLAAGFISIIFAFSGQIVMASWLILVAMAFDFLDGFSARLLKAYSPVGKELDSLADMVSFGVAPAVIIHFLLGNSLGLSQPMLINAGSIQASLILLAPVIMVVCAALRLAIFNIDDTQSTSFRGIPTPASALAVISVVFADHYSQSRITELFTGSEVTLLIFTLTISLLMVTRIPFLSLKTNHLKFRGNQGRYILIALVIATLAIFGFAGAIFIIPLYIVISLIMPPVNQVR
jgi:CDP-diacylglycerol---serine O-phosphatidyltransferase